MSKPGILFMPHGNLQYSQLPIEKRGWVVKESYEKIFAISEKLGVKIEFEASGETLEIIADTQPAIMKQLVAGIKEGRIEPVGSPHTHIMLANVGYEVALASLKEGLDTWERLTGARPIAGWNPECGWSSYIPEIFKEAGYKVLIADADSYFLSQAAPGVREATGLKFDVRGHSNKNALFKIEKEIETRPELLKKLMRPNKLPNGLYTILRSDMMCNVLLWYLMGATEGNRKDPISLDEVKALFAKWKARIPADGGFIMPYAEDAEYIGTTAYFFVKQFGLARFFEPAPESVGRFEDILKAAVESGYEPITPSEAIANFEAVPGEGYECVENGSAWHGGTSKAWANTVYSRLLDPVCRTLVEGLKAVAAQLGIDELRHDAETREILKRITTAYVSDARWPPAPTSPGRFNVNESLNALDDANKLLGKLMESKGLGKARGLHSTPLMETQIAAIRDELMAMPYFEEAKK
jgi:hypothetical protein